MVCRESRIRLFAGVAMSLVLSVFSAPAVVYAEATVGTNGAPARTSVHFKIVIPSRLEVSFPAVGEPSGESAQFRVNTGALSITSADSSTDPAYSYLNWDNTHELALPSTQQIYTVASP